LAFEKVIDSGFSSVDRSKKLFTSDKEVFYQNYLTELQRLEGLDVTKRAAALKIHPNPLN